MLIGKGRVKPEEAEIRGLRKALEKVKEERDILKEALAVFSNWFMGSGIVPGWRRGSVFLSMWKYFIIVREVIRN